MKNDAQVSENLGCGWSCELTAWIGKKLLKRFGINFFDSHNSVQIFWRTAILQAYEPFTGKSSILFCMMFVNKNEKYFVFLPTEQNADSYVLTYLEAYIQRINDQELIYYYLLEPEKARPHLKYSTTETTKTTQVAIA